MKRFPYGFANLAAWLKMALPSINVDEINDDGSHEFCCMKMKNSTDSAVDSAKFWLIRTFCYIRQHFTMFECKINTHKNMLFHIVNVIYFQLNIKKNVSNCIFLKILPLLHYSIVSCNGKHWIQIWRDLILFFFFFFFLKTLA